MKKGSKNDMLFPLAILVLAVLIFTVLFMSNTGSSSESIYKSEIREMQTVSSSDDVGAIEEDISQTDLDNLDKELNQIDSLFE